jgi:hypothetical protein
VRALSGELPAQKEAIAVTSALARALARALLITAAIGAVLVLGAQLVAPPLVVTAPVRAAIDSVRFIGPPLAVVLAAVAALYARRREKVSVDDPPTLHTRARGEIIAGRIFRVLVVTALALMALGLLSGLWITLVLTAGATLP